jgi:Protein of unknown function (DUF1592)/Protein of unknown function (DUF1588)/Protein of unknown function (DUF1595)/Protein of unknown function (DUF1585)/Protein of unknown function (DUF1587)
MADKDGRVLASLLLLSSCTGVIGGAGPSGGSSTSGSGAGSTGSTGSGGGTGSGTGTGAGTGSGGGGPDACAAAGAALQVGRTLLRRMTRPELDHTVRDLLGTTGDAAAGIAPDERIGPFFSNGIAPPTNLIVQQHAETAAALALAAVPRMNDIAGCNLQTDTGTTCAKQFIADFGLRAYRRPLDANEQASYLNLFTLGRTNTDAANGFELVVEAMLQSPFFLYHADLGDQPAPSTTPVSLTSYELASRLSYFLWNSMPDRALFDLAGADRLRDPDVLASQVDRMLADPRAGDSIPYFHLQWLGIDEMDGIDKDTTLYPQFNAALVDAMQTETGTFTDRVIRGGDGRLGTLFTASFSYPTGPLFALYKVAQPAGFKPGDQVMLDPAQRGGLLTQAAFLTAKAHRDQTSPVHRGLLVRENLLCQPIPSPPIDVNTTPPPVTAATTTRERFAAHEANPSCGGCHVLMDPIGLGFENYDPVGRFRTDENGLAVDNSGNVIKSEDIDGSFHGVVELASKLAGSEQVARCAVQQVMTYAVGRSPSPEDLCSVDTLATDKTPRLLDLRDLIVQITKSDAFRRRKVVTVEVCQ